MKSYVTSGTGSQQTLTGSQDEKVAVYQTLADAQADLANLEAGQIVATPDTGDENAQPVDEVTDGDMHAVTSNAVFDTYAVITAGSTTLTGKPPISQGSVIKVMFTSAISGSNTTTAMSISYNGTSYPVKVGKNGSLANFVASEISSGVYRYLQAYTTLELAFDGTQFIVIGNPVVLSSADYTIYADGNFISSRFKGLTEIPKTGSYTFTENGYLLIYSNGNGNSVSVDLRSPDTTKVVSPILIQNYGSLLFEVKKGQSINVNSNIEIDSSHLNRIRFYGFKI